MIPKTIHYIWFGGEKPKEVLDCIETWKTNCPGYEIKEWNETNCDFCDCDFFEEAVALRQYAFASDVIRLAVLSKFGGIYLDTDVKLIKPFDDFLNNNSFIGLETPFLVSTAVIGSHKGVDWIQDFLERTYLMRGKHFILRNGDLDIMPNTKKITEYLSNTWHRNFDKVTVYPEDFFCCKSFFTKEIHTTENSVAVHDFACTWKPNDSETFIQRVNYLYNRFKIMMNR